MYDDVQSDTAHALKFLVQTQAYEAALLQVKDLLFPAASICLEVNHDIFLKRYWEPMQHNAL